MAPFYADQLQQLVWVAAFCIEYKESRDREKAWEFAREAVKAWTDQYAITLDCEWRKNG